MSERSFAAASDIGSLLAEARERIRKLESILNQLSRNHGNLAGLNEDDTDDHPQYIRKDLLQFVGDLVVGHVVGAQRMARGPNGSILFSNSDSPTGFGIEWREAGIYYAPWDVGTDDTGVRITETE